MKVTIDLEEKYIEMLDELSQRMEEAAVLGLSRQQLLRMAIIEFLARNGFKITAQLPDWKSDILIEDDGDSDEDGE